MKAVADALKYDGCVKEIKLGWCKLGVPGADAVADLIRFNTTLDTVELQGNTFGNDGCILVARVRSWAVEWVSRGGLLLVHFLRACLLPANRRASR